MQVEIEAMRGAIQVAVDQRNSTAKKLVETTNDLNNTAAERIRLEKLGAELAAKAVKLSEALKYAQISLDNFKKVPPAGLSGLVTAVPLPDVVEISLGAMTASASAIGSTSRAQRQQVHRRDRGHQSRLSQPRRLPSRHETAKRPDPERRPCRSDHQNPLRRPLPWQRPKQRRKNTANRGPMSTRSCSWLRC